MSVICLLLARLAQPIAQHAVWLAGLLNMRQEPKQNLANFLPQFDLAACALRLPVATNFRKTPSQPFNLSLSARVITLHSVESSALEAFGGLRLAAWDPYSSYPKCLS